MSDQELFSLSENSHSHLGDFSESKKIEAFVFQINERRFGIELPYVQEVCILKQLTPVPAVPPFIKGLVQLRRKILCVVDLPIFLDLPLNLSPLAQSYLLVLNYQNRELALLIDQAEGIQSLALSSNREEGKGLLQEFIMATTQDAILILDGKKFLKDARLLIGTHRQ
ncbi:chemotaxis protein CheW [Candidatus Protochlamydia phocaeensis]|uniref:chemotaxis protein CheW n=1 Tax=Candidatus Protochlamydia phocaeensis TaxID=1414722 RepID=UPI000838F64F|nr:chemotaxis protein CheW [Candidatus Protochlamydia phocaeensis]